MKKFNRFFFSGGWPVLVSSFVIDCVIFVSGFPDVKAVAIFPFSILRYFDHPKNIEYIRHEKTHCRQVLDCFIVCYPLVLFFDFLYLRFFLGLRGKELYYMKCTEQECYRNQQNASYLKRRKFGALWYYVSLKNRLKICHDKNGELIIS